MTRCGTVDGYRAHFDENNLPTCQPCRDAQAAWQRAYEIRRYIYGPLLIDSTGTARRLRALSALGWPLIEVGRRLGVSGRNVYRLLSQARVHRDTAAKVAALYDELSMTPGPSRRSRQLARAAGWPPPMAWDDDEIDEPTASPADGWEGPTGIDEVAVQRAMRGAKARPAERAEAVRRLTAAGLSAAEIAARLKVTPRTVSRIRGEQRRAAA